jgi:transcriptional regulator with PAS, ATPase and Fis domain
MIMKKILISWIGFTDIEASNNNNSHNVGPIANALDEKTFDNLLLLSDLPKIETDIYINWLKNRHHCTIDLIRTSLTSPTNFGEIYTAAIGAIDSIKERDNSILTYHLSPGTPAMAAVWILIAKTSFPAEIIESSLAHGTKSVNIPFDISIDVIPKILKQSDDKITRMASGMSNDSSGYNGIVYRSEIMQRLVFKAKLVALRSVPVLFEGESGTGKELFARAIHDSSPRKKYPFVTINCGAIPSELFESELFGYKKGAFTGAINDKTGHFEAANKGTLFLDEIGELPLAMQVKLLRVLQEGEVTRVGSNIPNKIDTRLIAATNKDLIMEVSKGTFREDLFYRIAVAVLKLPPIRKRIGDIGLLIDHFVKKINEEMMSGKSSVQKKLSASAKNILLKHSWPGNIRELQNTLTRAIMWSPEETISENDIKEALFPIINADLNTRDIYKYSLENGIDLPAILDQVAVHYLKKGLELKNGNKTETAKILGLSNYQTVTNWLKKYNLL